MKIYFKHPNGVEFMIQTVRRQPLESGKFYAVTVLLAGALFVVLVLGAIALG